MRFSRLVAIAVLALGLTGGWAHAQPVCTPATTPCQTCPSPPPCVPSNTPCGPTGITNTTFTTSTVSCSGGFAQNTVTIEHALGPAHICVGPQKSVGCLVAAGTDNFNANTDSIFASVVAVPTLSLWGLGALVVALGAWALRRLRLRAA
jgi:hypothetical protein